MNVLKHLQVMASSFAMVALGAVWVGDAHADDHTGGENITYKSIKLDENIWIFQGEGGFTGGNILVSKGVDGVVMVDDGLPKFFDLLNKTVSSAVGQPVDYILNTHLHGDHTGNNAAFAQSGSHIIAHQNVRNKMLKDNADPKQLPVFTFQKQFNAYLNGHSLHAVHVMHAHTDGDAFIHYPDLNLVHTGDIFFNGLFPFIDLNNGGSVKGYIEAQQAILSRINSDARVVPGHGPIASKADLIKANTMLKNSADIILALIYKGKTKEDVIAANPLKFYHDEWSWGFITTEKFTATLYDSLYADATQGGIDHSGHNH